MNETNAIDYASHLDLMVDEFQRIAACPGADEEIKGLCRRAVRRTLQRVPVIEQRDRAEARVRDLERQLAEAVEERDLLREMEDERTKELQTACAEIEELQQTLDARRHEDDRKAARLAQPSGPRIPEVFLAAVRKLVIAGRTTGGTAGRDEGLCEALDGVEALLPAYPQNREVPSK